MEAKLSYWTGNGLFILERRDLNARALLDGSGCRVYAAAYSQDDLFALIAEYRGEPNDQILFDHVVKRWVHAAWPIFMARRAGKRALWVDYGPAQGRDVVLLKPVAPMSVASSERTNASQGRPS